MRSFFAELHKSGHHAFTMSYGIFYLVARAPVAYIYQRRKTAGGVAFALCAVARRTIGNVQALPRTHAYILCLGGRRTKRDAPSHFIAVQVKNAIGIYSSAAPFCTAIQTWINNSTALAEWCEWAFGTALAK